MRLRKAKTADAVARVEIYEKKMDIIDKTEEQIGRAILESQQMADKIIDAAKKEASEIVKAAQETAETAVAQAKESVSRRFGDAREKLDVLLCGVADYKKRIEETRGNASEFFASVETIFSSMQEAAVDTAEKFKNVFKTDSDIEDYDNTAENEVAAKSVGDSETAGDSESALRFDFSNIHSDSEQE